MFLCVDVSGLFKKTWIKIGGYFSFVAPRTKGVMNPFIKSICNT